MTTIKDGTEYLDEQERHVYMAISCLNDERRTTNTSQVAAAASLSRTTVSTVLHHLRARGYIRDIGRNAAYHWRLTGKPVYWWRDRNSLAEFIRKYAPDGRRVVAEVTPDRDENGDSPFIIVRDGNRTVVLCVMSLGDHLCIDVHSFIDGQAATASVFGMTEERQMDLPPTGTTSHGRPSASLVSVLIGDQGGTGDRA